MKKGLLIAAVAVTAVFASCKKDYTCTCNASMNFLGMGSFDTTFTTTYTDVKKKDAKSSCNTMETTYSAIYQQFGGSVSCDLDKK